MLQDTRVAPDAKTFYVADMAGGCQPPRPGRPSPSSPPCPPGAGRTASIPGATRSGSTSPTGVPQPARDRPARPGPRQRHRLLEARRGRELADPRRRGPQHGQRERRPHPRLAQRPVRRARLRLRPGRPDSCPPSPSAASPTGSRWGPNPAATPSATRATCADPTESATERSARASRWAGRYPTPRTDIVAAPKRPSPTRRGFRGPMAGVRAGAPPPRARVTGLRAAPAGGPSSPSSRSG
jgi:hypothetical protein